ncbi:MAG: glutaminyl-peptide cyclotransferase [Flavobacteriales bacterium]
MIFRFLFSLIITSFILVSCGNNVEATKNIFSLQINNATKKFTPKSSLKLKLSNKKNKTISSVDYYIDNNKVLTQANSNEVTLSLKNQKLGKNTVKAVINSDGDSYSTSKTITIVSSIKPILYTYKILETYPHDIEAYTQGLEFKNDTLYESTGLYKKSTLRKTNYKTGEVLQNIKLQDPFFGEGITILNNKIYQLTWQQKTGFIYDLKTLKKTGTFVYHKSKEGWGLCHDGKNIYKSDGTEKIWTLNETTLAEENYIELYTNKSKVNSVNELEWVDGKIYANIYQKDAIAIVNPSNGAVEGVINLTGLKEKVKQHEALDVLNGIAYNGEKNILYITGKNWNKLFKIEVIKK